MTQLPRPKSHKEFDIRRHGNVVVMSSAEACHIFVSDLVEDILKDPNRSVGELYDRLGQPELVLLYCRFDSGGTSGYAFIEHGERTRTRLQSCRDVLVDAGQPKDFESAWLNAEYYLEDEGDDVPPEERMKVFVRPDRKAHIAEWNMTSCLLSEAMRTCFGVDSWEIKWDDSTSFFKLSDQKPWWKLW